VKFLRFRYGDRAFRSLRLLGSRPCKPHRKFRRTYFTPDSTFPFACASERKRKANEIIAASGADSVEHFEKVVGSNHGIAFRQQAESYGCGFIPGVRNRTERQSR
jgi:hypothetical protein